MTDRYQTFTTLLGRCTRAIKRIKNSEMEEFGLKGLHVSCLYYVYVSQKPLTATELCDMCNEDKANVSRAVETLEEEGFVVYNSKTQKKYNCPIVLTEEGKKVAKIVAEKIDTIVALSGRGISEEDRKIFYASFTIISDNLERFASNI